MSNSPTLAPETIRAGLRLPITRAQTYAVQAYEGFTPTYEYPNSVTIEERLPGELGFYLGRRLVEESPDA